AHHLDAARRALVERDLVLQLELEAVVRLVLRVPTDRDDRDVVLHLNPVPNADDLRLRLDVVLRLVPRPRCGRCHRQGEQRRAAGAHRGHGAAILAHDEGEALAGLQRAAARIALHALWHGRRSHLLDRDVRVVGLAHRGCSRHPWSLPWISRGHGHARLAALGRSDDAQSGATEVTEDRAVRDSSTALVTEQGETSCSPAMASPTYLSIRSPVSWLRPSLPEGALKYRESNPLPPA